MTPARNLARVQLRRWPMLRFCLSQYLVCRRLAGLARMRTQPDPRAVLDVQFEVTCTLHHEPLEIEQFVEAI